MLQIYGNIGRQDDSWTDWPGKYVAGYELAGMFRINLQNPTCPFSAYLRGTCVQLFGWARLVSAAAGV